MLLEIFFSPSKFVILFPSFIVSDLPFSKKADVILENDFKMNMKLQGDWILKPGDEKNLVFKALAKSTISCSIRNYDIPFQSHKQRKCQGRLLLLLLLLSIGWNYISKLGNNFQRLEHALCIPACLK